MDNSLYCVATKMYDTHVWGHAPLGKVGNLSSRILLLVASQTATLNIYDSEIYSSIYSYEGT